MSGPAATGPALRTSKVPVLLAVTGAGYESECPCCGCAGFRAAARRAPVRRPHRSPDNRSVGPGGRRRGRGVAAPPRHRRGRAAAGLRSHRRRGARRGTPTVLQSARRPSRSCRGRVARRAVSVDSSAARLLALGMSAVVAVNGERTPSWPRCCARPSRLLCPCRDPRWDLRRGPRWDPRQGPRQGPHQGPLSRRSQGRRRRHCWTSRTPDHRPTLDRGPARRTVGGAVLDRPGGRRLGSDRSARRTTSPSRWPTRSRGPG